MPKTDALALAQTQTISTSEFSGLTRVELEAELEKLCRRETLFDATERAAKIGTMSGTLNLINLNPVRKNMQTSTT